MPVSARSPSGCAQRQFRGPGTQVQLTEMDIRQLCLAAKEFFMGQPSLLELGSPIIICGVRPPHFSSQYLDHALSVSYTYRRPNVRATSTDRNNISSDEQLQPLLRYSRDLDVLLLVHNLNVIIVWVDHKSADPAWRIMFTMPWFPCTITPDREI